MNGDKLYKWVIGVLVPLSLTFSGYILSRVDHNAEAKLSIAEYRYDQGEWCKRLERMENKIEKILDYARNGKKN